MRKDAVDAAEHVRQLAYLLVRGIGFGAEGQAAGEVLGRGQSVGGPVERVAAVVDSATRLGWIVHGAEVLPFRGAHLGACLGGAGRIVGEEGDEDGVGVLGQEATQLVEPERALDSRRRLGEFHGGVAIKRNGGVGVGWMGGRVMEGFEVFH